MNTRAPRPTTGLLQRLARALQRHLPAAIAGDNTGVHQARVTSRRLREAVPVLSTGLKGSKAGKATRKIRRLTRALGTVRELDVTLLLLDELSLAPDISRNAVEDVRAGVVRERDARVRLMLKRLGRVERRQDRPQAGVPSGPRSTPPTTSRGGGHSAARLLQRSKRLIAAMDEAGHMYSPERLHAVRIAARSFVTGSSSQRTAAIKVAAPQVRTIKRVQDVLGKLHDLQVLQTHIAAAQIAGDSARPEPRAALEVLAAHVEAQCRHLHAKYLLSSAALREVPGVVRKGIVPQLVQLPRPTRSVKMGLARPPAARAVPIPTVSRTKGPGSVAALRGSR